jgi:adenylate cyclase class 2
MSDQELEIKFYLLDPEKFSRKMASMGSERVSMRMNEWNLRFDTPGESLTKAGQALRLRKDNRIRLTYKGPAQLRTDITARQELEVEVSDFQTTRQILVALGYQVAAIYEKFRTTWKIDGTEVVLDELPIGVFCEIEGQNAEQIQSVADRLGLNWERRLTASYLNIFGQLKQKMGWPQLYLTFTEMAAIPVDRYALEKVNILPADE